MISFNYESEYQLVNEEKYTDWLENVVQSEKRMLGNISYVFCNDAYLLAMNQKYLNHDTYTDILTFDYTDGHMIAGDIFISTERIAENALKFDVDFNEELRRVMAHGILHLSGYKDKDNKEVRVMRAKEEEKMKMFHVEQ